MSSSDGDVIVVGSGGAGMMAAMAAADEGARVVHFEKMPRIGGCWAGRGGTTTGAQTGMQFEAGIYEDSPHLFYADCMKDRKARERCDPEVLMFYCQRAGQAVDWLDSLGSYPPEVRQPRPGIYGEAWSVPRCYPVLKPLSDVILAEYEKRVSRGDIEVHTYTTVTDLLEKEGRVWGARAKVKDGSRSDHRAGAVIVCTGGFGSNIALIRRYNLPNVKDIMTTTPSFARGDGLIMCEKVGARLVNMDHTVATGPYGGGVPNPANPERQIAHVNMNKYPGAIWVDTNGRRVVNEDCGMLSPEFREALAETPEQTLVVVLDRKIRDENKPILVTFFGVQERSWEWFDKKAEEGVLIKKASTIEELGNRLGVNARNLKDTITRWNGYVAAGKDPEFDRKEPGYKIESPPFYAIPTGSLLIASSGGPAVDVRQQVLGVTGKVIPGLYVAGEIAGFQGYGTGMFNMGNFVFGQQAGRMAAIDTLYRRS